MHLVIISPQKTILDDNKVESVTLPGAQGKFQVLKNHMNLVSQLVDGDIVYVNTSSNEKKKITITKGITTVHNDKIIVLVD